MPVRCAVLPPVAVPYREPLFTLMGQSPAGSFASVHSFDAVALGSLQQARTGRTTVVVPRGVGPALSEFDPEVVVSWEYGPTTLRSLAWCRRRGRRLVIFSELPPHADSELPGWQLRLHRALARRADGFVVASSAARRRAEAIGAPPERLEVSLQSADLDGFAPGQREPGPLRLLYVGRLVEDKNLRRLLQALRGLDARLELCGTGPLEAELHSLDVDFRGYVAPADLPARFAAADALVLPSLYEPFGVAVREAAAAGLPIVCSCTAGAAGDFAVEGRNAVLVDPLDERSIRAALELVAGDEAARERMAAESLALTREHPLADDAAAFVRAITRAAAAAPRRGSA